MASAERRLRLRGSGLDWRVLEDETVVLDLDRSRYIAINRAGSALWRMLADGATRGQLVAALTRECDVEEPEATRDIDAFCARLAAEGLLDCR
jgi:hypothetical protein